MQRSRWPQCRRRSPGAIEASAATRSPPKRLPAGDVARIGRIELGKTPIPAACLWSVEHAPPDPRRSSWRTVPAKGVEQGCSAGCILGGAGSRRWDELQAEGVVAGHEDRDPVAEGPGLGEEQVGGGARLAGLLGRGHGLAPVRSYSAAGCHLAGCHRAGWSRWGRWAPGCTPAPPSCPAAPWPLPAGRSLESTARGIGIRGLDHQLDAEATATDRGELASVPACRSDRSVPGRPPVQPAPTSSARQQQVPL
jgi:hypothetical protein